MIFKNILWDYFGRFSSQLMQIVTSILLMRIIDEVSEFGLITLTLAVNAVASTFSNFGFSSYIIQHPNEDDELQSSIFWFNLGIGLIITTFIILLAPWLANFYHQPRLTLTIIACSFFIPITLSTSIPTAILAKRLQFKQINLRNIFVAALSGLIGITFALLGFEVWALVIQQAVNLILNLVTSYHLVKWKPKFVFNKTKFTGAYHFGKFMFLATLVESVYSKLDVFTIGKVAPSIDKVAQYSRAQGYSGQVIQMSSKSILNVLFPIITKMKDNKEELKRNYFNFFHHISLAFCLISASCFLLAEPAFATLFKNKWGVAALYFKIIILSSVVLPLSELMLSFIEGRGNSKNYFKADVIKKFVLYPTIVLLFVYKDQIEPYLYANFFALFIALGINLFFLNKEIEVGYFKSIKILLTYFIPTLVIAFLMDKIFITGTNWAFAFAKVLVVLFCLIVTLKLFPSPTVQLIFNKIKKKNN